MGRAWHALLPWHNVVKPSEAHRHTSSISCGHLEGIPVLVHPVFGGTVKNVLPLSNEAVVFRPLADCCSPGDSRAGHADLIATAMNVWECW